jgi:hypothetical protein
MAALLAAARAHAARLRFHQVPIGFVGPQAGAEPLRPEHIGLALMNDAAASLLGLLALPQLANQLNLPAQPARTDADAPGRQGVLPNTGAT